MPRKSQKLEQIENDWRKVLAFAASAGDTISTAEALAVIKSIARQRLGLPEHAVTRATA